MGRQNSTRLQRASFRRFFARALGRGTGSSEAALRANSAHSGVVPWRQSAAGQGPRENVADDPSDADVIEGDEADDKKPACIVQRFSRRPLGRRS